MKKKVILLKALMPTPLELALIRSLLSAAHPKLVADYIEIENYFIISCDKAFKDQLSADLTTLEIKYILVYMNTKAGADVFTHGTNSSDTDKIASIVLST